jgi:glycosyltransferase involved in cell wall biosynthesis
MPNAVLEAMSEGLPVVVNDAQTGLRDVVRDGVTGVVVPAGKAAPLAQAMLALARDAELRRRLGEQARLALAPFHADAAIAAWRKALVQ